MALVIQKLLNHCYIELGTYFLSQFNIKTHHTYSKSSKFLPIQIDIGERPFQVVFLYDGSIRCSGAWMGGKNILTSGVCCDGVR